MPPPEEHPCGCDGVSRCSVHAADFRVAERRHRQLLGLGSLVLVMLLVIATLLVLTR
jgi:hypothetical protein